MDKTKLSEPHQSCYDGVKALLTQFQFQKWYEWALYLSEYKPSEWKEKDEEYKMQTAVENTSAMID